MTLRDFDGKTVLVTGAQQGIGRACALALAKRGADVVVHYYDDRAAAEEVSREIESHGCRALLLQANLAEASAATHLAEEARTAMGPLHAVINNAGIFHRSTLADLPVGLWDATLDVNLRAAFLVCQAAVAAMRRDGIAGAIVNLSSVASFGTSLGVHYSASKGGMDAMTRAIAIDVARDGIRVNAVAPGIILTAQALEGNSETELEELAAKTLPGRYGTADEVAAVAVFLASDQASFVNGEILAVNGGAHMA